MSEGDTSGRRSGRRGRRPADPAPAGAPTRNHRPLALARGSALAALLAGLVLAGAAPAAAQEAGRDTATALDSAGATPLVEPSEPGERARWILDAGTGLLTPLADLAPSDAGGPETDPVPAPVQSVGISASARLLYLFSPNLGFGVLGSWATTDVDLQRLAGPGGTPAGDRDLGSADVWAGAGEIVFRPLGPPRRTALDPYLSAGGGVRRLSFTDPSLADSTDPLVTVAGGVRTTISGPFFWTLEGRGFFSSADPTDRGSRQLNDVLVTVGLGLRL